VELERAMHRAGEQCLELLGGEYDECHRGVAAAGRLWPFAAITTKRDLPVEVRGPASHDRRYFAFRRFGDRF
jgi:hypothetical protein